MIDSTCEDKLYQTPKFAGAFRYNAQKNCATLLCRACLDEPICVAVMYLTLRTGCERYGRKNPLPYSFSERSHIGNLRQIRKQGKGRSSKRKENRRLSFLFAPAAGRGTFPPSADGESPLRFSEKLPARKGRTRSRSSCAPLSRCRKIRAELINQIHLIKAYPKKTALSTQ